MNHILRQRAQIDGECIDQAVQRLERHRFLFVAASFQDDGFLARMDAVEKLANQDAFAHPRLSMHEHAERVAGRHLGERLAEPLDVALATD